MKLSQAIAIGAAATQPASGKYFSFDFQGNLCACALGCAIYALNPNRPMGWYLSDTDEEFDQILEQNFPELESNLLGNGESEYALTLYAQILHANDFSSNRDRNEIAKLVESMGF